MFFRFCWRGLAHRLCGLAFSFFALASCISTLISYQILRCSPRFYQKPWANVPSRVGRVGSGVVWRRVGTLQYRSNKCNDVEKRVFDMRSVIMLRLLPLILGAGTLDDTRIEPQATWRQQRGAQFLQEFGQQSWVLADRRDGKTPGGLMQHTHRMRETESVGIQFGLQGRLVHEHADGVVDQQHALRRLRAQGARREA